MTKPVPKKPYLASDGLPARSSQAYAKEKLTYVRRYMSIFATGMKDIWPHRVYMDLMAGPGLCRLKDSIEEFPGSPLLSLEANFTRRLFIESDPVLADALRRRTTGRECEVIEGDCNNRGIIERLRDATDGKVLGLAFVDNLGLNVPFSTLARLVDGRSIDLLIVMQLQDLRRNVLAALEGGVHRDRFDAFMGTPTWLDVAKGLAADNARPMVMSDALIDLYFQQFASVGHNHADQCNYEFRNSTGATQYRLALISAHPLAVTFLKKISTTDPQGQRSFLD